MPMIPDENCLRRPDYWAISAWTEHVPFAFWIMDAVKPRTLVELGTHYGMSYFAFCQSRRSNDLACNCLAVDTWEGDEHAGTYGEEVFQRVAAHNAARFSDFSQLLRMRFDQALEHVPDGSVDLLHIDGRHFYDDVKEDFESWRPKLSDRAVVLFHDTQVRERGFGVWKFWSEIENDHPSFNFQHGHGLGVLAYGAQAHEGLETLFDAAHDEQAAARIRRIFSTCGRTIGLLNEGAATRDSDRAALADANGRIEDLVRTAKRDRKAFDKSIARQQKKSARAIARVREQLAQAVLHEHAEADRSAAHGDQHWVEIARGLQRDLILARRKPLRVLRDYLTFKTLKSLAKLSPPLSPRAAARFGRSAAKRDPRRSAGSSGLGISHPVAVPSLGTGAPRQLPKHIDGPLPDPTRRTVLVVSHDARRTGAPVLALNIARELAKRHNVAVLLFGGGELLDDFRSLSVATYVIQPAESDREQIDRFVAEICSQHHLDFAIVNSVASRFALSGLRAANVRTVSLVHEFVSTIRTPGAFAEIFEHSDRCVFSTELTLQDALAAIPAEGGNTVSVVPQGKCSIPNSITSDRGDADRKRLAKALRPMGDRDEQFLVIGAGEVQWRKGLDLFVECANRVMSGPQGGRYRFVWIGEGYNAPHNQELRALLEDQVHRSGIQSQFDVIESSGWIEDAYAMADLLLIPSRLDPLPNVAIDAMHAGTPVVCFERATGVADLLTRAGLGDACVAQYLDTKDMAEKIAALAAHRTHHTGISQRTQAMARETFDMARYVEKLETLGTHEATTDEAIKAETDKIEASGRFRSDFYRPYRCERFTERMLIHHYVRESEHGLHPRKPMPGFHPTLYAFENGLPVGENALLHYLRAGDPSGPGTSEVIAENAAIDIDAARSLRVALQIHAFYPEALPEIMSRLRRNALVPDLFVSARKEKLGEVRSVLDGYGGRVVALEATRNRGRDIGPLLTLFGPRLVDDYDVVGHVHTKLSPHVDNRAVVERWSQFTLENVLGGKQGGAMMDRILTHMVGDPQVGIVFPDDPHVIGWNNNRSKAESLAARLGVPALPRAMNFPAGTMFWMRSPVLRRFVDLGLEWEDYPGEPLPPDGSMLHALERLFGVVGNRDGFRAVVTNVRGVNR